MAFDKVTVIGMGLLGGSLGMALRERQLAGTVTGFVRRPEAREECLQAGALDAVELDLAEAVREADLIILCTPIARMPELVDRMMPHLKRGVLVTDVGSVKGDLAVTLEPLLAKAGGCFIGSHPMAGSEKTGVGEARANLFENAICVVTPTEKSPPQQLDQLQSLWKDLGGRPLILNPHDHDVLVGRSSHLPHLIAAQLAHYVLNPANPSEQSDLCAGGFRDTTRIASGSVEMWRDICMSNREPIGRALDEFMEALTLLRDALKNGDEATLQQFLTEAKERRDRWRETR